MGLMRPGSQGHHGSCCPILSFETLVWYRDFDWPMRRMPLEQRIRGVGDGHEERQAAALGDEVAEGYRELDDVACRDHGRCLPGRPRLTGRSPPFRDRRLPTSGRADNEANGRGREECQREDMAVG